MVKNKYFLTRHIRMYDQKKKGDSLNSIGMEPCSEMCATPFPHPCRFRLSWSNNCALCGGITAHFGSESARFFVGIPKTPRSRWKPNSKNFPRGSSPARANWPGTDSPAPAGWPCNPCPYSWRRSKGLPKGRKPQSSKTNGPPAKLSEPGRSDSKSYGKKGANIFHFSLLPFRNNGFRRFGPERGDLGAWPTHNTLDFRDEIVWVVCGWEAFEMKSKWLETGRVLQKVCEKSNPTAWVPGKTIIDRLLLD